MFKSSYKKITTSALFNSLFFHPVENASGTIWYIETDPNAIKNICLIPENSNSLLGKTAYSGFCKGGWDYLKRPFNKHTLYRTVSEILNDDDFEQTSIYLKFKKGRLNQDRSLRIYKKLKRLIKLLKNEGYLSQYELGNLNKMQWLGNVQIPQHELVVGMDRNGELMRLAGGKHRLAVAQQAGIEHIPAILSLVHGKAMDRLPKKRREISGSIEDFKPF